MLTAAACLPIQPTSRWWLDDPPRTLCGHTDHPALAAPLGHQHGSLGSDPGTDTAASTRHRQGSTVCTPTGQPLLQGTHRVACRLPPNSDSAPMYIFTFCAVHLVAADYSLGLPALEQSVPFPPIMSWLLSPPTVNPACLPIYRWPRPSPRPRSLPPPRPCRRSQSSRSRAYGLPLSLQSRRMCPTCPHP